MISQWWLVGEGAVFFIILCWTSHLSYRHGIWDGAFNHFLPIVRKEMMRYDEHRAAIIFAEEDVKYGRV